MTSFMSSQPTCVNNNTGVSLNTVPASARVLYLHWLRVLQLYVSCGTHQ